MDGTPEPRVWRAAAVADSSGIVGSAGVTRAAGVVGSAGVAGSGGVIGSAGVVGAAGVIGSAAVGDPAWSPAAPASRSPRAVAPDLAAPVS